MATLAELTQRRQQLISEIAKAEALIKSNRQAVIDLQSRLPITLPNSPQRTTINSAIEKAREEIARQTETVQRLTSELDSVKNQIAGIQQAPVQSTGQTVKDDSQARGEAANATVPPTPPLEVGADGKGKKPQTSSNATRPSTTPTTGTNAPTVPLSATQTNPPPTAATALPPVGTSRGDPPVYPSSQPAARSGGDDAASSTTTQRLNAIFGDKLGQIVTQPNILDEYLTYTYNASIYILSPDQYRQLMTSRQKNLAGYQLLMRSGGAPLVGASTAVPDIGDETAAAAASQILQGQGRNQFFPLDFYIDDIRMRSIIQGKGSGGAHNVVELNFKIFEPNGISLVPNLQKAASFMADLSGSTSRQGYAAQIYLMVIRFYGQNADGDQTPVKGTRRDQNGQPSGKPEVIEKYIPFLFTGIKFRVVQRVTEYDCSAVCPQNYVNTSRGRGVIPYNVEITSKTLKDLFAGKLGFSTTQQTSNAEGRQDTTASGSPGEASGNQSTAETRRLSAAAPPKADAAARSTINQGLFEALNKYQEDLCRGSNPTYTYPDEYSIVIDPVLADAQVVPPGDINKTYTPMNVGQTARDKKDPATNRMDTTSKNTSARAGMSIVQFIDQYTRTSTYVYDQQIAGYDPRTGEAIQRPYIPGQVVAWYHIGLQAEPKLNQWDPKRNDYAYRIKFSLTPYQINDLKSDYFPQSRFQGAHKRYDFWFTGRNSQVINFEQDFNYLYYLVINNPSPTQATGQTTSYDQYQDEIRRFYQPRSDQSSQGQEGKVNEPSANAADYLYSPADQARVKITIVGDPAWIQQGELWQGVSGLGFGDAFLSDGTISFDNREVLFEVAFNTPVDYNLDNGIMDPGARNYDANRSQNQPGRARQSYVYRAIEVTSMFSQGQFTQELNGVLVLFDLPRNQQIAKSELLSEFFARTAPEPVSFAGSEFGAFVGSGETGGAVNYRPKGLSKVLDERASRNTPPIESNGTNLSPAKVNPATSNGQIVGSERVPNTTVPQNPGSTPPITPITQLTPAQQKIIGLRLELTEALKQENQSEVKRLSGEIAKAEIELKNQSSNPPQTRINQTVKER